MTIINFNKKFCPVHAKEFEYFKVAGIRIEACSVCTQPNKKYVNINNKSDKFKEVGNNLIKDKKIGFIENWKDYEVVTRNRKTVKVKKGLKFHYSNMRTEK